MTCAASSSRSREPSASDRERDDMHDILVEESRDMIASYREPAAARLSCAAMSR
jgi:hypothetical protein